METKTRLQLCLLFLRITVFLVMFMWTLDKFVNPAHAAAVYKSFYFIGGLGPLVMYVIGALEMILLFAFLFGIAKTWTYGLVLLFHAVSTFSSFKQYFLPFQGTNLLFFAAWPMLAACFTLFMLRKQDNLLVISKN